MYAQYEEQYGLLNNSVRILDKATSEVSKEDRLEVYSVLIARTASLFELTKTRSVFVKAIESLDYDQVVEMGVKFASVERKLGEVERARAIFSHVSQFCNPGNEDNVKVFWNVWENFELYHGNEETYKEMLRIKRAVANKYSLNSEIVIMDSN